MAGSLAAGAPARPPHRWPRPSERSGGSATITPMTEISPLGPRFADALAYAATIHRDQRRKGGEIPYIAHLLAVAALVIEDAARGGELTEDLAIAALLHDAAEDQGGRARLDDIAQRYGAEVARVVAHCSDSLDDGSGPRPPWRERKEAYLAALADADRAVLRVSLADKLHNTRAIVADLRELGPALWKRFDPEADALWYQRSLSLLYLRRLPGRQADEHAAAVAELAALSAR